MTCYSPLGGPSYGKENLSAMHDPVIKKIAKAHKVSAAQVCIRWALQRGTSVVPKSMKVDRMRENISVFDFKLTDQDMDAISKLDKNIKINDPLFFCGKYFFTFHPVFEWANIISILEIIQDKLTIRMLFEIYWTRIVNMSF